MEILPGSSVPANTDEPCLRAKSNDPTLEKRVRMAEDKEKGVHRAGEVRAAPALLAEYWLTLWNTKYIVIGVYAYI
jgi:hypothetical protein